MTDATAKVGPRHPDPEVVRKAEAVFGKMGMTPEEAIAIFYKQTALQGVFPITDLVPNEKTQKAIRAAWDGKDVVSYGSIDEMMAEFDDARANSDGKI